MVLRMLLMSMRQKMFLLLQILQMSMRRLWLESEKKKKTQRKQWWKQKELRLRRLLRRRQQLLWSLGGRSETASRWQTQPQPPSRHAARPRARPAPARRVCRRFPPLAVIIRITARCQRGGRSAAVQQRQRDHSGAVHHHRSQRCQLAALQPDHWHLPRNDGTVAARRPPPHCQQRCGESRERPPSARHG